MDNQAKNSDLCFPPKPAPPVVLMATPSFRAEAQGSSGLSTLFISHLIHQQVLLGLPSKYLQNATT